MGQLKVLHIASFSGNIGDNANHNGFRNKLSNIIEKDIIFKQIEIRQFYNSWKLRSFNDDSFIKECNDSDLVVIGGGNFFEICWNYSATGTTIDISKESLEKIETPILFNGLGSDIAKGTSQELIKRFEFFLDELTKSKAYFITLRNDGSFCRISKLYNGKYDKKIYKVPDGAFFMKVPHMSFLSDKKDDKKYIGVNLAGDIKEIRFDKEKNDISYDEFIEEFAGFIENFLNKKTKYNVIFFPHIFSDLKPIYDVMERLQDELRRTRVFVAPYLVGQGNEKHFFSLLKNCDLNLGMRFHSNVCSLAQEVLSVGLHTYPKIEGLFKELDLEGELVKVNKKNYSCELEILTYRLLNDLKSNESEMKNKIDIMMSESTQTYNKLREWLKYNKIIKLK